MLTLARQTVRGRRRTFVSTFIVVLMATVVVSASGVLVESGLRGDVHPDRYAGAPVVIAGRQHMPNPHADDAERLPERVRVPASVAEDVAAVPGVRAVVADRIVPVTVAVDDEVVVAEGATVGQGWGSAVLWPVEMVRGRPPESGSEVVLDEGLAGDGGIGVGDDVRVTSTDGAHIYEVVGLAAPVSHQSSRNLAVFFTDEVARSLAPSPDHVDALGLLVDKDADVSAVAAEVDARIDPSLAVLTGRARSGPESLDLTLQNEELVEFGAAFGGTAAMLAVLVVAVTLGMVILQRGREMALLKAVGATPRQVRRMLVGEAGIVALAAGIAGIGPGLLLGSALFGVLRAGGMVDASTSLRFGPSPVGVAVATGLIVACVAAWLAGRRAARLDPTSALAEAAMEPRRVGWLRVLLGGVLVSGGLALSVLASALEGEEGAAAVVGVLLTLIIGVAVLGPVLARGAGAVGGRLVASRSRTSGFLAMVNLRARSRRLASASTPLALAVAMTITMVGSFATEAAAAESQSRDRLTADRVLAAPDGLPTGLAETVRAQPGVLAAVEVLPTAIGVVRRELFGERIFEMRPAAGLSISGAEAVLDLDVQEGSVSGLTSDGIALSTEMARSTGVDLGEELTVWLGDGTERRLQVQATYERALGFGDFVVAREVITSHVTNPMADHILVALDNDADHLALDGILDDLIAQFPGASVVDRAALHEDLVRAADQEASINYLFVAVLATFVMVAMVNSLVLATAERGREFALLRLIGATPQQVRRMTRWEGVVLVAYGSTLGIAVAAATLVPFSLGIAGTPIPSVPPPFLVLVLAGALALGLAATEIPTRLALRRDPTETLTRAG